MENTIIAYKLNQTTINILKNISSKINKEINIYYLKFDTFERVKSLHHSIYL